MRLHYFLIVSVVEIVLTMGCKKTPSNQSIGRHFRENPNGFLKKDDNAAIVDESGDDYDIFGNDDDDEEEEEEEEEEDSCSDNSVGPTVQRLPAAVIIGTKKGGTRALLEFLNIHSQIRTAKTEIHFYDKKYEAGVEWYRQQMPGVREGQVAIEKTPGYFHSPGVAARLQQTNPETKLVVIVRHPVTRLVSDYNQFRHNTRSRGKTYPDLSSLILTKDGDIDPKYPPVVRSRYQVHMKRWLEVFPREQIYVVDGDQFISSPWIELRNLEAFLGLNQELSENNFYFNKTKGFYCGKQEVIHDDMECTRYKCLSASKGRPKPKVSEDLLLKLTSYFKEDNERFFSLLGKRFKWNEKP